MMKFQEREKRPIFFYSNSLAELFALKACGTYQRDKAAGGDGNKKLKQLLALLCYNSTTQMWSHWAKLNDVLCKRSANGSTTCSMLQLCTSRLSQQVYTIPRIWARCVLDLANQRKPRATLRIRRLLQGMCKLREPTEEIIVEAARLIAKKYGRRGEGEDPALTEEVRERSSKPDQRVPVNAVYDVHPESAKYCRRQVIIPGEYSTFATFDFPHEDFKDSDCTARLIAKDSRLLIDSNSAPDLTRANLPLGDISAIILDMAPISKGKGSIAARWLAIKGRKIRLPLSVGKHALYC